MPKQNIKQQRNELYNARIISPTIKHTNPRERDIYNLSHLELMYGRIEGYRAESGGGYYNQKK